MKPALCLFIVMTAGCASHPSQMAQSHSAGDVIELPEARTQTGSRRSGFECGVLLRDDFTLFHEGECERQRAGRSEDRPQPRELTVRELTLNP